ncbi:efflux pump kojT [Lecanosticta acicola]|uniref:Efflux pump kojT n=1 Tax=Lecanosticta acicola TaxID=111012 RepID=A0AAI9E837_9PEZI|nr:efflux pump kojT [Lecanosticta acicola]
MQSYRQYHRIRAAVEAQAQTGRIVNLSNEKTSVLDDDSQSSRSNLTTTTVRNSQERRENEEAIIVGWDGVNDPLNPRNWSIWRRAAVFGVLWINVFAVDWASAADGQAGGRIAQVFHVSEEAESLSSSLYTFGIALGSLFAGPIAETVGRNPVYVVSRCFHVFWLVGAALAPNFGAQCIFRFLAGLSGSILLAIHAASTADIYGPVYRTLAWPIIAIASFFGTSFAPIPGAWIYQAGESMGWGPVSIDWRWADWIPVILSASTLILTLLFLPETFSPILLTWRAKHLRDVTGDGRFLSEMDLQKTVVHRLKIALLRAFHMITREPIVLLLGGWLVLEYIVVFGLLQGMSYIFGDTYGFDRGLIGTCFVAIGIGAAIWTSMVPFYYHAYKKKVEKLHEGITGKQRRHSLVRAANLPGQDLPDPEYRLWSALLAAPAFPISLFWLGWTNYPSISPWSSLGAIVLLGFSWAGVYVTVYHYLLDTYGIYAGSSLAIVTCWRYLASGFINLVSRPMYDGMGVHWVMTMLGCIAVLQMPLPIVFYFYGERIRKGSAFAKRYARPENSRERIGRALEWK